jgi:hypothetical protein
MDPPTASAPGPSGAGNISLGYGIRCNLQESNIPNVRHGKNEPNNVITERETIWSLERRGVFLDRFWKLSPTLDRSPGPERRRTRVKS